MTEYNFVKYKARQSKYSEYISLSKVTLNIGKRAYEILGNPKNIAIYFDQENKVIKIIASKGIDTRKVSEGRHITASGLARLMPLGRYILTEGSVFVHEPNLEDKK